MPKTFQFFVYMMASETGTLYVGMTTDIAARVDEHKSDVNIGFTKMYQCHKLVYFEEHKYIYNAIERENQLKKWRRNKKEFLINTINPSWKDLSLEWII